MRILLAALLLAGLSVGVSYAQDAADLDQLNTETAEADAPAEEAPAPEKKRRRMLMDEVVVSAQRRDEDVRDVPISMSVMSGDDMRDAGVNNFNDLALLVPNISVNTDWFTVYMRGVGTSEVNVMAEQAVAYMFDNVYVARVEFLRAGFLDVERLEVLKGPQGVLFGRNSPAGVINVTQGKPSFEWGMRAEGTIGQLETKETRGMVTGPLLGDKVAFRLAGSWGEVAPHTENLFDPNVPIGGKETMHLRGKLLFDISSNFSVTLNASYFDYNFGQWASTEQTYTPEEWKIIFRTQDPKFEDEFDRRGSSRDGSSAIGNGYILSAEANLDWKDHMFSFVSSFGNYSDVSGGDLEATAFPLNEFGFNNEYWQFTEELKVISPPGDFEYVAGLFGFRSHSDAYGRGLLFRDIGTQILQDIIVPDALSGIFDAVEGALGGPTDVFDGDLIDCYCILDTWSAAAFGQATWHVTEDITLMAGGRFTWEKKEFEAHLHAEPGSVIWGPLLLGPGYDIYPETTYTDFSPKASVTWEVMEEMTVYLTYAEGFRSGSFNVASFKVEDVEFDPESSTTYEAGVKTTFFDGLARINVGLFWTDYTDYQVTTFETITFESSNAEEVRVRGLEADFTISPFEGLVLVGSLGYNDASYVKFTEGSCPTLAPTELGTGTCTLPQGPVNAPPSTSTDLSGRQLFRAPKWTGSINAILALPLNVANTVALVAGSASFRGTEYIDPDLDPRDIQEAHWIFGARAGIRDADGLWSFEIQGKNLSDEIVKITSFDAPIALGAHMAQSNAPRTFVAKFRVEF